MDIDRRRPQAKDAAAHHRLSASGFADDSERASALDGKAEVVIGAYTRMTAPELRGKPVEGEDVVGGAGMAGGGREPGVHRLTSGSCDCGPGAGQGRRQPD